MPQWYTKQMDDQWATAGGVLQQRLSELFQTLPDLEFELGGSAIQGLSLPRTINDKSDIPLHGADAPFPSPEELQALELSIVVTSQRGRAGRGGTWAGNRYIRYDILTGSVHPGYALIVDTDPHDPDKRRSNIVHVNGVDCLSATGVISEFRDSLSKHGLSGYLLADLHDGPPKKVTVGLPVDSWERNIQPGLRCPVWPEEVSEWPKRPTRHVWPSEHTIEKVLRHGPPVMVPKAHIGSSNPDVEWKFDFHSADNILAATLKPFQRQAYRLFVILVQDILQQSSLEENLLTHILFHVMEQNPVYSAEMALEEEDQLSGRLPNLVLELIDKLRQYISQHNLPHYYMPDNNLLDHVTPGILDTMKESLDMLRKDPISPLIEVNEKKKFPFSLQNTDFRDVMAPVIKDAKSISSKSRDRKLAQYQVLLNLCRAYLTETKLRGAVATAARGVQMAPLVLGGRTINMEQFADEATTTMLLHEKIELMETFIKGTEASAHPQMYKHLVCLYHSASHEQINGEMYTTKAEEILQSLSTDNPVPDGAVKYLPECQRSEEIQWRAALSSLLQFTK